MANLKLRHLLPFVALALAVTMVTLVFRRLDSFDFALLLSHAGDYSFGRIVAAIGLVFFSLILAGLYETAMLAELGSPISVRRGMLTAFIANPIGHTVGFSTLSAGALRYRLYAPLGLPPRRIAAVIALSAFPYVLGIGLMIDVALIFGAEQAALALRLPPYAIVTLGVIGLIKDVGYVLLTQLRRTPFRIGSLQIRLPSTGFTFLQFGIGVTQLSSIALVLYLFMPPELAMGFAAFLVVYLISMAAGSLSNVPAGLGVLEAALLLMLPQIPPEQLIAAVLAYRAVYELLSVAVALVLLASFEVGSEHGIASRFLGRKYKTR